jgi:hypothetical protein
LLNKGYAAHGKSWVKVASLIPGRTQRQCRTRWVQLYKDEKDEKDKEVKKASVPEVVTQDEQSPESYDDSDAYDEEDFE